MYWQAHRCKVFWAILLGQNVLVISMLFALSFVFPENVILNSFFDGNRGTIALLLAIFNLASLPMSVLLAKRVERYTEIVFKGELLDQIRHDSRNALWGLMQIAAKHENSLGDDFSRAKTYLNKVESILSDPEKINKLWKSKKTLSFIDLAIENSIVEVEQYINKRARKKIDILFKRDGNLFGAFSTISQDILERSLGNILNNSVEAIYETNHSVGRVEISLSQSGAFYEISIKDNGIGLDQNKAELIFNKRVSFKKERTSRSGMGLGLSWVKDNLQTSGADISFVSEIGIGATVKIKLPKAQGPYWYCHGLDLTSIENVIVIDESHEVYNQWQKRLGAQNINLKYISDNTLLEGFLAQDRVTPETLTRSLFLIDFDYKSENMTGFDILKTLRAISSQISVVIVTDKLHNAAVYDMCRRFRARILPKSLIEIVPIKNAEQEAICKAIILDDDEMSLTYMKEHFEEIGLQDCILYKTHESELFECLKNASKNIELFLDDRLGEHERRGHQIANELWDMGFKNISLMTGAGTSELKTLQTNGVKEILPKSDLNLFYYRVQKACELNA